MAITSVSFNQNNMVLDRHKIMPATIHIYGSARDYAFDFVDLNSSGHIEMDDRMDLDNVQTVTSRPFIFKSESTCYHYKRTVTTEEPSIPLQDLKHWAQNHQTEVITEDDIPQGFQMTRKQASRTDFKDDQQVIDIDPKTPKEIASKMEPFETGVKWAVDVAANEFIVYRPK